MTRTIETIAGIRAFVSACRQKGKTIGFVPTMGAFHEGHLSLMREARRRHEAVIVSIFVNPLQFSAGEDFDRYPRRIEQDTRMAESEGVDVMFAPSVAEMYPKGFDSYVDQTDLPAKLCGAFRPGHFRGVMTIVTKLFNIVKPHAAYFGQKDYQQYLILRRTVTDLNLDVDVRVLPTVREDDGLAMSSRNLYLGPKQRKDATCLHRALKRAEDLVASGESSAAKVSGEMKRLIHRIKGTRVEYVEIVNSDTLEPVKEIKGKTLIALAVRIGKARLIDNAIV
ncbi:MAG TPA: pantoate--beta-alanine ligase [Planctomycetota bacterium]|nr:pantoate--beta-alanine ligase [Planctomycetota bacterium]